MLFLVLVSKIRGKIFLNFYLNLSFLALLITIGDCLLFSFSKLRSILYIRKNVFLFYSFIGISLCPYGNVFIPSSRIYLLSPKSDKDVLLLSYGIIHVF